AHVSQSMPKPYMRKLCFRRFFNRVGQNGDIVFPYWNSRNCQDGVQSHYCQRAQHGHNTISRHLFIEDVKKHGEQYNKSERGKIEISLAIRVSTECFYIKSGQKRYYYDQEAEKHRLISFPCEKNDEQVNNSCGQREHPLYVEESFNGMKSIPKLE